MSTENHVKFVESYRRDREQKINQIRKEQGLNPIEFEYFPISKDWRIQCELVLRKKVKEGFVDYKDEYERVGKVKFQIKGRSLGPVALYRLKGTEKYHVFVRDLTSGQSTYSPGRIIPILTEDDTPIIDFNLASNPLCAYVAGAACPLASDNIFYSIEAGEKSPKEKISYE